jgi:hypothetical protein
MAYVTDLWNARAGAVMELDGVKLMTRTPNGGFGHMVRVVRAIRERYEVSAAETVTSIYEDDKSRSFFEVELDSDLPRYQAQIFAADIKDVFREMGGYNGLEIWLRAETIMSDDPWWPEDFEPPRSSLRLIQGGLAN